MKKSRHQGKVSGLRGTYIPVRNNNMKSALRKLKKILTDEDAFKEMRDRRFFVKKSEKRRRKKAAAVKRHQKEQALRNLAD